MSLDPYNMPMDRTYRLRMAGCNSVYMGAAFVDGVTVEPVNWRDARRIAIAFGTRSCQVEFYSEPEATPEPQPEPEVEPPAAEQPDLDALDREELLALATEMGLEPHHRMGAHRLRTLIANGRVHD